MTEDERVDQIANLIADERQAREAIQAWKNIYENAREQVDLESRGFMGRSVVRYETTAIGRSLGADTKPAIMLQTAEIHLVAWKQRYEETRAAIRELLGD